MQPQSGSSWTTCAYRCDTSISGISYANTNFSMCICLPDCRCEMSECTGHVDRVRSRAGPVDPCQGRHAACTVRKHHARLEGINNSTKASISCRHRCDIPVVPDKIKTEQCGTTPLWVNPQPGTQGRACIAYTIMLRPSVLHEHTPSEKSSRAHKLELASTVHMQLHACSQA